MQLGLGVAVVGGGLLPGARQLNERVVDRVAQGRHAGFKVSAMPEAFGAACQRLEFEDVEGLDQDHDP